MNRTIIAISLISLTASLICCTKQSESPMTVASQPQPSAAHQTQASQAAPQAQAVSAAQQPQSQPSVGSASATSTMKGCPEPYRTYCDTGDVLGESLAQWKADNLDLDCVPQGDGKWKNCTFQDKAYTGESEAVIMHSETVSFVNGRLVDVVFRFYPDESHNVNEVRKGLVQRFGEPEVKSRMLWAWENSHSSIQLELLPEQALIFALKENVR